MGGLDSDLDLNASLLNLLYYDYFTDGELLPVTAGDFLKLISDDVVENEAFTDYFDQEMKDKAGLIRRFSDANSLATPMNAEELAAFFDMDIANIKQLFLLYQMEKR